MGNQILGKRPLDFFKGFNEEQVQYIREKFEILKDDKGFLSKPKFQEAYRCPQPIAVKSLKFLDFSENSQVDEYEFICAVAALCNADYEKITDMLFSVLADKKDKLDEVSLETFTAIVLNFNRAIEGIPDLTKKDITAENRKKFKKWDCDSNKAIESQEFKKMCLIDKDYKTWMFNMGFITRRQLQNEQDLYAQVDSDLDEQYKRHTTKVDLDEGNIKKGIQHGIKQQKLQEFNVNQKETKESTTKKQPWRTQILNAGVQQGKPSTLPPSQNLSIDYVYGYRSFDCRNNLKFNSKGKVVYHTGSLGIVLDPETNKQDFMNSHSDDVTCLDVVNDIAVTGQLGAKPIAVVWNTQKVDGQIKVRHILTDGLKDSVGDITISGKQPYVAVSCNDDDHTIVIYDIKKLDANLKNPKANVNEIVATGSTSKSIILDIKFTTDQKYLVAATARQILFITFKNKTLNSVRGNFDKTSPSNPVALAVQDNLVFSTMVNNSIYVWQKGTCIRSMNGHLTTVTAICCRSDKKGIISADKQGNIIAWNDKFEIDKTFEINNTISRVPSIISLSSFKNSILAGTRAGSILKFSIDDKNLEKSIVKLVEGHYDMELWAMCIHPKNGCFYTGGQDRQLMKWKYAKDKKLEKMVIGSNKIRTIDVNGNLNCLAVGYNNGVVEFWDSQTLVRKDMEPIVQFKNPDKEVINLVKFDRQGKNLAICYTPPNALIAIYDMFNLKKKGQIPLEHRVKNLDFSSDAKYVQLNTHLNDYQVYVLSDFKRLPNNKLDIIKNQQWHTYTLTMSPFIEGLFTSSCKEDDIEMCCVSPNRSKYKTIVVGDRFSHIKLFNYPCFGQGVFNVYKGHSSNITNVRFSEDCKYVISLGGLEKSIILWKYDDKSVENNFPEEDQEQDEGEEADMDEEELQRLRMLEEAQNRQEQYEDLDIVEEQEGEEAMAVKAFLGNIKAPSNYEINEARDNRLPDEELAINYVFGVRNFYLTDEVRNQCKFTKTFKELVYPTAALGIKLDISNMKYKRQQFFQGHVEDIVSFAVDNRRQLMATGQMADKNSTNPLRKMVSIHVWDIQTKKQLKKLDGFHTIAVVLLSFSPDSRLLFSCGNDDKNSYAVYNWKAGVILFSGPISGAKVNAIAWKGQDFATCGNRHVKFWNKNKNIEGSLGGTFNAMFSICLSGDTFITGSGVGELFNWQGGAGKAVESRGHKGKVHTICCFKNNVYSGADDGLVLIWDTDRSGAIKSPKTYFDIRNAFPKDIEKHVQQTCYGALSIDFADDGRMAVVTSGCDIIVYDGRRSSDVVMSGHSIDELWALAVSSQNDDLFVTGGDDGTLRLWSINERRELYRYLMDGKVIRGIDWSRDGKYIVVASHDAYLYLFSLYGNELRLVSKPYKTKTADVLAKKKRKKNKAFVEEVKFSPDGKYVVFGAHGADSSCELLAIEKDTFREHRIYKGHTSSILHIDWSKNSEIFSTNSQSYELLFLNVNKAQQVQATACRDEQWATWTRKIGWPVLGIFQGIDYTDVNTVCADREKRILAVGYDDQSVRLFKYPAYVPKQVCRQYLGHSSHVTRVRFNQSYLVSLGGNDKTIIIWDVKAPKRLDRKKEAFNLYEQLDANVDIPLRAMGQRPLEIIEQEEIAQYEDEGDEFMAVKPWLGAIKQPSYKYKTRGSVELPNVTIDLQYVYGYRCKDSRQNLFYTDKKSAVYHAAAVLIYHDFSNNSQKFMTDHDDDIISIAYHKNKQLVLTGQLGARPWLCLTKEGNLVKKWKGPVKKGIMCVGISPAGKRAACVGMDDKHEIAIVDLQGDMRVIAREEGGVELILKVGWIDQNNFVTAGVKHFKTWSLQGNKIKGKKANLKCCFVSLAIRDGLVLTGSEKNQISMWKGTDDTTVILEKPQNKGIELTDPKSTAAASVVEAISIEDNFIAAGCKNKLIYILSKSDIRSAPLNIIDMEKILEDSVCPSVRSLDFTDNGNRMLVGTLGAQIYELSFKSSLKKAGSGDSATVQSRLKGHYSPNSKWTNEVWGLCVDQKSNRFFTCSDDTTLRCWDMKTHKMLSCASLNWGPIKNGEAKPLQKDPKTKDFSDAAKGRVVALSPQGNYLVVGCKNGVVRLYHFDEKKNQMEYKLMFRKANQEISDIKMSPGTLVIGSHDNAIYVYDFDDGAIKERFKALKKHSSYITHMDISRDSANLHSTCGAYELLFWDLNSGKQLTSGATMLKDERWATWTTTLGWPVQGIWPKCADGTFFNSVCRSNFNVNDTTWKEQERQYYLLAAGNDFGKINIFNFPCIQKSALFIEGRGHSSHVTNVKWSADDKYLISTGGEDQCVMQWRVNKLKQSKKKP